MYGARAPSGAWPPTRRHYSSLSYARHGAWGSVVVTALLVGPGIDSRWCHWGFFSVATDRTMCPGVDSASKNECHGFLLG